MSFVGKNNSIVEHICIMGDVFKRGYMIIKLIAKRQKRLKKYILGNKNEER